jgi:ATP synthase I chain
MTTPPPAERVLDARMRRSIAAVAATGAVFSVGAAAVFGLSTALSVAIGAAVATANLWALARIIAALVPTTAEGARAQNRAGWGVVAILKILGLVALVWLLMRHGLVSVLPMVVGFGSLPIGIAIGSLVSDRSAGSED